MNHEEHQDYLGNIIKEGDQVLVLVPRSGTTWRRAIVRKFRKNYGRDEVYVEYINDRLYGNMHHCYMMTRNGPSPDIKFSSKPSCVWRDPYDIIKFDTKYIDV
jgi:hypothetical protein